MKVTFVGAGPGDPELLTRKAERLLRSCRFCIYAGSLVSPEVLALIPSASEKHDSAALSLDQIVGLYRQAQERDVDVVRLHSGDPGLFSAIGEQMSELDRLGIEYAVIPGVSSFQAAAAALKAELTAPEVAQAVVLTRVAGRTPVPEGQELDRLAGPRATLCLFLSVHRIRELADTLAASYGKDCPAAAVHRASWPDEKIVRGVLGDIAGQVEAAGMARTALIVVGHALARGLPVSRLYNAAFSHGFRAGSPAKPADPEIPPGEAGSAELPAGVRTPIALISVSDAGARAAARLSERLPVARAFLHESASASFAGERYSSLVDLTSRLFSEFGSLVYSAPCGAVVRAVAPLLQNKKTDPAVVVVDAGGRYAISLLSGHEGGGNALAVLAANALGGEPVITTASEAVKTVIAGIGCRRGVECARVLEALHQALEKAGVSIREVRLLASADIKAGEAGLLQASARLGIPIRFIPSEEIRACPMAFSRSEFVEEKVNLPAVAEPAALLGGRRTRLLLPRILCNGITVALAREGCW